MTALSKQTYHLVRPAVLAVDDFEGERVFAVRNGDQIKPEYRSSKVGGIKPIRKEKISCYGESYVIRTK